MKRILLITVALFLSLTMASCTRPTQRQVEQMIEQAVQEALENNTQDDEKEASVKNEEDMDNKQTDEKEDMDKQMSDDDSDESKDDGKDDSSNDYDVTFDYAGDSIPKGFPVDEIPLYESGDATIIGGISASTDGGEKAVYSMGIGTDNDTKEVIEDVRGVLYDKYDKDDISEMTVGSIAMFVIDADKIKFMVQIRGGGHEDFETLITYSVLSDDD